MWIGCWQETSLPGGTLRLDQCHHMAAINITVQAAAASAIFEVYNCHENHLIHLNLRFGPNLPLLIFIICCIMSCNVRDDKVTIKSKNLPSLMQPWSRFTPATVSYAAHDFMQVNATIIKSLSVPTFQNLPVAGRGGKRWLAMVVAPTGFPFWH